MTHQNTRKFGERVTRRTLVGTSAGAVAGGIATRSLAQNATPEATPAGDENILKSTIEGIPDAILKAPEPFKSYEGTPANGGTVRFSHLIYGPPATPRADNSFWQELERRVGLDFFDITEIPVDTYAEKLSAVIAGGDLGDLLYLNAGEGGAAIINRSISEGAFLDLTDYLTGDALQEYPNLAALPEEMWTQSSINGRIYGIPTPIYQGTNISFYRKDWTDKLGMEAPTSSDDLRAMYDAFTNDDPDGNGNQDSWGSAWTNINAFAQIFRVPNTWRLNDDGSLTHQFETDEYMQVLDFRRELWTAGYMHPNAPTNTQGDQINLLNTGRIGIMSEGFGGWWGETGFMNVLKDTQPGSELVPLMPFGWDGGEAVVYPLPAYYGMVALPVTSDPDEDRIRELLRISDFFYPPFGSEEYIFQNWGIEGEHHTVDENGDRQLTSKGTQDISQLLYGYVVSDLYIYHPGFPEHARMRQQVIEEVWPLRVMNPVSGLYSEVQTSRGPVIGQIMTDAINEYVLGRSEKSDMEAAIERWRNEGGNEIRAEYEELLRERDSAS